MDARASGFRSFRTPQPKTTARGLIGGRFASEVFYPSLECALPVGLDLFLLMRVHLLMHRDMMSDTQKLAVGGIVCK